MKLETIKLHFLRSRENKVGNFKKLILKVRVKLIVWLNSINRSRGKSCCWKVYQKMPDNISGLRPVVRRVSATQKDLINRFERSSISGSSSVSNSGSNTPTSLVSRSRAGSVKKTSVTKTSKAEDSSSTTTTTPKDTVVRKPKSLVRLHFSLYIPLIAITFHSILN